MKKDVVAECYRAGIEFALQGSVEITTAVITDKDNKSKDTVTHFKRWSTLRVWLKERLRRAHSLVARLSDPDAMDTLVSSVSTPSRIKVWGLA